MNRYFRSRLLRAALAVGCAASGLGVLSVPMAQADGSSSDLTIAKSGPAFVKGGDPVTYQIVVSNNGPDASSGWMVRDLIPAQFLNASTSTPGCSVSNNKLSCNGGPLPVGSSFVIMLSGTAGPTSLRMTNTASVYGNDFDPNTNNDTSSTNANILAIPLIDPAVGTAAAGLLSIGGALWLSRRKTHRRRYVTNP